MPKEKTKKTSRSGRKKSKAYSKRSRKFIGRHVRMHRHEGMGPKRAVAAAMSEARRKGLKVPRRRTCKASAKRQRRAAKR